jgi:hypothetical protein
MYPASAVRVSELLLNGEHCDLGAWGKLIRLAYGELPCIAHHSVWSEHPEYRLQSAAPVHEPTLRFPREKLSLAQNLAYVLGVYAQFNWRTPADHGRTGLAAKREWATTRAWPHREMERKESRK